MIYPGLVSITFRQLSAREVVALAAQAHIAGVEWGGDIHVPPGDLQRAETVRQMTVDAGLHPAVYGSYYRVWPQSPCSFNIILDTAAALGAETVRVWAGKKASAGADQAQRARTAEELERIAGLAAEAGVRVALEYHPGTLTDTPESAGALLEAAKHPNLFSLWQPRPEWSQAQNLAALRALGGRLSNLHVFTWRPQKSAPWGVERLALADGRADWSAYLQAAAEAPDAALRARRWAMIEFVRGDRPEAFLEDAAALKSWLKTEMERSRV